MTALLEREVSGEGQWVQSNLLGAMIAMMDFQAARFLMEGDVPQQAGNDHPTSIPTGVFPTADGHINIAAAGDVMFAPALPRARLPRADRRPAFKTGEPAPPTAPR